LKKTAKGKSNPGPKYLRAVNNGVGAGGGEAQSRSRKTEAEGGEQAENRGGPETQQ